jgi:hypothetical protein
VTGKVFIDTFGVFAEFEANLRRERHLAVIMRLKRAASTGVVSGRLAPANLFAFAGGRLGLMAIAHRLELAGQVSPAGGSHLGKRGWQ